MTKEIGDDEFGGCPECGYRDFVLNDGREHWYVCDTHLTRWHIGSNLFSGWRNLTDAEAIEERDQLMEYRPVEASHPEPSGRWCGQSIA